MNEDLTPSMASLEDKEQLAVIRDAGYGMRDFSSKPGLWFDVHMAHGIGALQCFFGEDANKVIADAGVYRTEDLNGKPCYVTYKKGIVRFSRIADDV